MSGNSSLRFSASSASLSSASDVSNPAMVESHLSRMTDVTTSPLGSMVLPPGPLARPGMQTPRRGSNNYSYYKLARDNPYGVRQRFESTLEELRSPNDLERAQVRLSQRTQRGVNNLRSMGSDPQLRNPREMLTRNKVLLKSSTSVPNLRSRTGEVEPVPSNYRDRWQTRFGTGTASIADSQSVRRQQSSMSLVGLAAIFEEDTTSQDRSRQSTQSLASSAGRRCSSLNLVQAGASLGGAQKGPTAAATADSLYNVTPRRSTQRLPTIVQSRPSAPSDRSVARPQHSQTSSFNVRRTRPASSSTRQNVAPQQRRRVYAIRVFNWFRRQLHRPPR